MVELKDELLEKLGTEFLNDDRGGGYPAATKNANKSITVAWRTREGRWSRVSGKKVFSELSRWSQDRFGVSFGVMLVLRELKAGEFSIEIINIISAIERGQILEH